MSCSCSLVAIVRRSLLHLSFDWRSQGLQILMIRIHSFVVKQCLILWAPFLLLSQPILCVNELLFKLFVFAWLDKILDFSTNHVSAQGVREVPFLGWFKNCHVPNLHFCFLQFECFDLTRSQILKAGFLRYITIGEIFSNIIFEVIWIVGILRSLKSGSSCNVFLWIKSSIQFNCAEKCEIWIYETILIKIAEDLWDDVLNMRQSWRVTQKLNIVCNWVWTSHLVCYLVHKVFKLR